MGIKHILAAVGKPTTTGKIERWFGTYDREAWRFETLDDFLFYPNHVRHHQSLDYEKPMEVFFADLNESQRSLLPFHYFLRSTPFGWLVQDDERHQSIAH